MELYRLKHCKSCFHALLCCSDVGFYRTLHLSAATTAENTLLPLFKIHIYIYVRGASSGHECNGRLHGFNTKTASFATVAPSELKKKKSKKNGVSTENYYNTKRLTFRRCVSILSVALFVSNR